MFFTLFYVVVVFFHTNVHSTFIVIVPKKERTEMPPGVSGQTTWGTTEHYLAIKPNELLTQTIPG